MTTGTSKHGEGCFEPLEAPGNSPGAFFIAVFSAVRSDSAAVTLSNSGRFDLAGLPETIHTLNLAGGNRSGVADLQVK